ncbi:MAG TPA: hypothetical protein VF748_14700 [Candidatus Acidoferrum sp.]
MAQTPERRVKAWISEWLRQEGIRYFMPVQTGYGSAGLDYFVCWHGQFVALEAKAGTAVTARQEAFMREIYRSGGTAWVVGSETSKDVKKEDVIGRLKDIDAVIRCGEKPADL